MVDIETYRARIGSFGASNLNTATVKLKIKLRCKVQRQISVKCCVQTLIFLWIVVSMTTLFVSLLYQEYVNTGMASSSHTGLVYSDKQMCMKCLFKHVQEFYRYILENYAKMSTEIFLLYIPSRSSTLTVNIWIPGSNTKAKLMENICNGRVHGTCSYLIGNVGSHAYHGNPPKRRGENIYDLHNTMVFNLSQMIAPGTDDSVIDREWNMFIYMLRRPDLLTSVEVARLKNMFDVFAILMNKGKIDYGSYEVVKRIMSQLQLMQCHDIITEHEERMASISQDGQYKKRMVSTSQGGQHEEQVAFTSQGSGQQGTAEILYSRNTASSSQMSSVTSTYIQTLSEEERTIYDNSLNDGKEKYRHIRVLYVGDSGVGKTTLCKNITGQTVEIGNEPSTNGVEVFTQIYEVLLDGENKWSFLGDDNEEKVIVKRLASAVSKTTESDDESPITDGMQEPEISHISKKDGPTHNTSDDIETNFTDTKQEIEKDDEFVHKVFQEKKENSSDKAFISMWDFAGQEDYYSTHHVFLSSHAVFVLVCNAQKCLDGTDEEKQLAHAKLAFWLRSIKSYTESQLNDNDSTPTTTEGLSEDKATKNKYSPPIILVGTHTDKVSDPKRFYFLPKQLKKTQGNLEHIEIFRTIYVDNSKGQSENIKSLKSFIVDAAKYQAHWEELIPAKWLVLERSILKKRAQGVKVLTLEELSKINRRNEVRIKTDSEMNIFLGYLHASRTVIFFGKDEILSRKVVINAQWLIDAFKALIKSDCFVDMRHTELFNLWTDLQETAKLTKELMICAWKEQKSFLENKDTLVAVLERFGLIALPLNLPRDSNKYYIVPHLLKNPELPSVRSIIVSKNKYQSSSLYLMFHKQAVPQEIYDRLISTFISHYELEDDEAADECVKRGFGFFSCDYFTSFVILCRPSYISLTLFCAEDIQNITEDKGKTLRKRTEETLNKISEMSGHTNFKFDYAFSCEYDVENVRIPIPLDAFIKSNTRIQCPCKRKPEHYIEQRDLQLWGFKNKVTTESAEKSTTDPGNNSNPSTVYNTYINVEGNMTAGDMFNTISNR